MEYDKESAEEDAGRADFVGCDFTALSLILTQVRDGESDRCPRKCFRSGLEKGRTQWKILTLQNTLWFHLRVALIEMIKEE